LLSVILNLIPVPPLDGFGIIAPHLPADVREKLSTPPLSSTLFFAYFMLLWLAPGFLQAIFNLMDSIMGPELAPRAWAGYASVFRH
jgi:Zn-dependent protease